MFRFFNKVWSENPINRQKSNTKFDEICCFNNGSTSSLNNLNSFNVNNNLDFKIANKSKEKIKIESVNDLDSLNKYLVEQYENNKDLLMYKGPANSPIMFVGEMPNKRNEEMYIFDEEVDILFNKMLSSIGVNYDLCYMTNATYQYSNNKKPTNEEINKSAIILQKQIEILKPKLIVLLGAVSLYALFKNELKITNVRGKFLLFNEIDVMPTYHPTYILKMPKQKVLVWEDLKNIKKHMIEKDIYKLVAL
jgi:DNA polymerase